MDTRYNHKAIEEKIYALWEKSGFFAPEAHHPRADNPNRNKTFTIIMPPPNANGSLHLGHAVFVALQDIMIRYKRMQGFKTLWLPGADHAGFETQVVYDKKLEKEGRNRFGISRDELYKEIWDFTQTNKKVMEDQLRKLGASCDWSRETFTLDEKAVNIVNKTFAKLYQDGLAYRGLRVVNWCPKHKTSLSDLETKSVEREDPLYYIKYAIKNPKSLIPQNGIVKRPPMTNDYLTVATVRPETMFGDTAITVHPKDKRYIHLIGKTALIPFVNREISIVADSAIDPDFGTGAVKVTPAHDAADFEIWQRHKKEIPGPNIVIDENGRLTGAAGNYAGLKVMEARQKIAKEIEEQGILQSIDLQYKHQVSTCYKCGNILEPLPKPQWFIKMKPLAKEAVRVVKEKEIRFVPDRAKKIYFHWLKNIRDWNISRQIPWGIRIPAWYCENSDCSPIVTNKTPPPKCPSCGSKKLTQDPDVFDTWFSSGQWPFATLGYPDKKDYKTFYPTNVMETGYDILPFWVMRMIILGLYVTGKVPFRTVYLHGLVRDKDRQKMSKSKGNVIDPLGVVELYGTDAMRMALIIGNTPGNDIVISEEKIRGYRNFANKFWNVARFVLQNEKSQINPKAQIPKLTKKDTQTLKNLDTLVKEITALMDSFKFYVAAEKLYHYIWHTFADKIIEEAKPRLRSENEAERQAAQFLLLHILTTLLKLTHPFMPFITEAIWREITGRGKALLLVEEWPEYEYNRI